MKLLKLLKTHPFCNEIHFFFIGIILLILGLKYYIILILFFLYLIFIFKKTKLLIPLSILLILIIGIIFSKTLIKKYSLSDSYTGLVSDVNTNYYIINTGLYKIKVNEYNHEYKPGDIVEVKINIDNYLKSYENDFDKEEYLSSSNILYQGKATKSTKKSTFISIKTIKYYYLKYLNSNLSEESYNYVAKIVFAEDNFSDDIKDSYSTLGIAHILSISGLHIILIYNFLCFLLLKIFHNYHKKIPLFLITLYVLIIGAPIPALRAIIVLLITEIERSKKLKYTKLDSLSISGILMLIYNPYMLYSISFILTYLVSFIMIFINDFIKDKSLIKRSYKRYFIIFLISLPFVIKMTNKISLLSLLLSPILSLISGFIIIPLSFILAIFPVLDYIFKYLFIGINYYFITLSGYNYEIKIKTFNIYLILAYYLLFSFLIYSLSINKNKLFSTSAIILFLIVVINFKYLNFIPSVTFIDVGQGDSTLIRLPNSQGVMLIDAYNSYSYLKTEGIDKIDYLVLTHSDTDHIGDYKKIIENINVKNIIYPYYDIEFDNLLTGYNNKIKVDYTYNIKIANFNFDIIGPINSYDDANSDSVVIKFMLYDYSFIFCGDMTIEEEYDLVNMYGSYLKSDVLKVGHHGSNTSSSDLFLSYVKPKYSIISVGLNNKYGHPDKDVFNKLNKISKVYMTKDCGNITFKLINNKLNIRTYR